MLASTIDSSAIGAGFLATAAGLLYSFRDSTGEFATALKKHDTIELLIGFVWRTFFSCLALVAFTWLLLVDVLKGAAWAPRLWLALIALVAVGVVQVSALTIMVLKKKKS